MYLSLTDSPFTSSASTHSYLASNADSPRSTEASAEPLRLPLELIEAILIHTIEMLELDASSDPTAFDFGIPVAQICRHFNAWAEERTTRSLEINSPAQLEDVLQKLRKYKINSAAKITVLSVTLAVEEKPEKGRRGVQEMALEELLGFCTSVQVLKVFSERGNR